MLYIIARYRALDTVDLFKELLIHRNIKSLNKELRSVFHSFKNTLFAIKLIAFQGENAKDEDNAKKALKRIQEVTDNSLVSITKMLDSFQEIKLNTTKCRVIDSVENAIKRVELGENIELNREYVFNDVYAYMDAYSITEILINILQNASEAIQSAHREKGIIRVEVNAEHEWAVIKITDNGVGIKKSDQHKIFKPFVTTKSRQTNWGVGLSYAFRVIKAHLGFITIDSVEGQYTTFQILLFRIGDDSEL